MSSFRKVKYGTKGHTRRDELSSSELLVIHSIPPSPPASGHGAVALLWRQAVCMMDGWFPPMLPLHDAVTMINGTLGNKSPRVLTAADRRKIQTAPRDGSRPLLSHTRIYRKSHTGMYISVELVLYIDLKAVLIIEAMFFCIKIIFIVLYCNVNKTLTKTCCHFWR